MTDHIALQKLILKTGNRFIYIHQGPPRAPAQRAVRWYNARLLLLLLLLLPPLPPLPLLLLPLLPLPPPPPLLQFK